MRTRSRGPLAAPLTWMVAGTLTIAACGPRVNALRAPRTLVVPSGLRLTADSLRMDSVNTWFELATTTMDQDPSFWVITNPVPEPAYPWETMSISRGEELDTVEVALETARNPNARFSYQVYGFLHLMTVLGRMEEFFPEAANLQGYDLERFILARTAESWLLGRSIFDTPPYAPLDEIVYASEFGFLDEMILTARPDDFEETRRSFMGENPGRLDDYQDWFRQTFGREPPGSSGG